MINQILQGDCLELMKDIPDGSIDLTVTSPPYFNAKDYSQYQNVQTYMETMQNIFELVFAKTKESRMCIVNISPVLVSRASRSKQSYRIPLPFYYVPMMEKIGFEFLEDIIWEKPEGSARNRNGGFYNHRKPVAYKPNIVTEYILVFKKPAAFLIDKIIKNDSLVADGYERTNVWKFNPDTKNKHPAPFPIELADKCIRYYSYEKDTVLDPFAGSGTTGIAAMNTNRNFILMEQEPEYVEIIKQRLKLNKERLEAEL